MAIMIRPNSTRGRARHARLEQPRGPRETSLQSHQQTLRKGPPTEMGVWIDHRKAVIAIIAGRHEQMRRVDSNREKHVRYSGAAQEDFAEDQRDRRFTSHLDKYYDEVIACLRDADSILILGPGEAKIELAERLGHDHRGRIVGIDTVDTMTGRQVAATVRQRFLGSKRKQLQARNEI